MSANIQHSAESVRWGTPAEWIEREREVFDGPIHFDPCSESEFNAVVGAQRYFSLEERGEDGLVLPWLPSPAVRGWFDEHCTSTLNVHENPPGGLIREFWRKTLTEPSVRQCIWTGFAMNQLNLLADEQAHPTDFSIAFLRSRIPFVPHSTAKCKTCKGHGYIGISDVPENKCKSCRGTGKVQGDRPSQNNYICGMGVDPVRFERVYRDVGLVRHGKLVR